MAAEPMNYSDRLLLLAFFALYSFMLVSKIGEAPANCDPFSAGEVLKGLVQTALFVWFAWDAGREHERNNPRDDDGR